MRFKGLDLNLLVALDALLTERSVSAAAQRLHLSQPAMSAALRRLREQLGDPLLVPHGKRMIPTAHGAGLAQSVSQLLGQCDSLLASSAAFDPGTSRRVFNLCASDYMTETVVTPLVRSLSSLAPQVGINVVFPSDNDPRDLMERGELDVLLIPEGYVSPLHPAELLFAEYQVVVGWRDNPVLQRPMTEDSFYSQGHIAVQFSQGREPSFAEKQLALLPRKRRIEVIAPSFMSVPGMLVGTHRLAVMHRRLAETAVRAFPLTIAPLPVEIPVLNEMMQYHRARSQDHGLLWLLACIRSKVPYQH